MTNSWADPDPVPPSAGTLRAGLQVLVADDQPINRILAVTMFEALGLTLLLAEDGLQAVACARDRALDLILMDISMPGLDGFEATQQIRAFERRFARQRVPVLAYSSNHFHTELLQARELDGVLPKPCGLLQLQACLQQWCAQPLPESAPPDAQNRFAGTTSEVAVVPAACSLANRPTLQTPSCWDSLNETRPKPP